MKKILLLPILLMVGAFNAGAQCSASATIASAPLGNALLRYSFNSTSTYGTLVNKQTVRTFFNFGDGNIALSSNPVHTYAATGTYMVGVLLQKFDSSYMLMCSDSITYPLTVAYPSCGSTISATTSPTSTSRTFTATTPAGATGMTYSWNFGDGNTGSGSPVTHTYSGYGTYTVTLTATRSGTPSCSYTNTTTTTILWNGIGCDSLHNSFTTSISGNVVTLTPAITYFPGLARIATYNYGDGTATTSATSHTYTTVTGGSYIIAQYVQWKDSATSKLVCQDSSVDVISIPNVILGTVYYDSLTYTGTQTFKIYLIKYNPATSMLTAVDSLTKVQQGFIYYYFLGRPAGNYLVKAVREYTTPSASGLVPTYHDSSLYWSSANTIAHAGYGASYGHVWMKKGAATTGPGFIGGNVSLGANKGAGAGVEGVNVLLRNASNKAIASVRTNAAGDFSFSNIPVGTYSVYPEVMNYATVPASGINITTGSSTVNGLYFHQDDVKMNIMVHTLGTPSIGRAGVDTRLLPNPASQSVVLSWSGYTPGNASAIISNATGQVVARHSLNGISTSGHQALDISTLKPGIYFVRMISDFAGAPMKLVVQ